MPWLSVWRGFRPKFTKQSIDSPHAYFRRQYSREQPSSCVKRFIFKSFQSNWKTVGISQATVHQRLCMRQKPRTTLQNTLEVLKAWIFSQRFNCFEEGWKMFNNFIYYHKRNYQTNKLYIAKWFNWQSLLEKNPQFFGLTGSNHGCAITISKEPV